MKEVSKWSEIKTGQFYLYPSHDVDAGLIFDGYELLELKKHPYDKTTIAMVFSSASLRLCNVLLHRCDSDEAKEAFDQWEGIDSKIKELMPGLIEIKYGSEVHKFLNEYVGD